MPTEETNNQEYDLPVEIWEKIFLHLKGCHLPTIRLVCRRWKTIVDQNRTLMVKRHYQFPSSYLDMMTVPMDENYKPEIEIPVCSATLKLQRIVNVDAWWPTFGVRLTNFELVDCYLTLKTLLGMLRQTPNLVSLNLSRMEYTSTEGAVPDFQLERLEELRVGEEAMFEGLEHICPRLKLLHLECTYLEEEQIQQSCTHLLQSVRTTLETLDFDLTPLMQQLFLEESSNPDEKDTDFPSLKMLNITLFNHSEHESAQFCQVLARMPQLETLDITSGYGFFDIDKLICWNLKKLRLDTTCFGCLDDYGTHFPNLRELVLEVDSLTGYDQVFGAIQNIPSLRHLKLTTDEAFKWEDILDNLLPNNLEVLEIYNCEYVEESLGKLLTVSPKIEELYIDVNISEKLALIICRDLPRLKHLRLDSNHYIAEKCADYIADYCPELKSLSVWGNDQSFREAVRGLIEERERDIKIK